MSAFFSEKYQRYQFALRGLKRKCEVFPAGTFEHMENLLKLDLYNVEPVGDIIDIMYALSCAQRFAYPEGKESLSCFPKSRTFQTIKKLQIAFDLFVSSRNLDPYGFYVLLCRGCNHILLQDRGSLFGLFIRGTTASALRALRDCLAESLVLDTCSDARIVPVYEESIMTKPKSYASAHFDLGYFARQNEHCGAEAML